MIARLRELSSVMYPFWIIHCMLQWWFTFLSIQYAHPKVARP